MTRRGLPAFAQLRSRTMFDDGTWVAMMVAYTCGAVSGIVALVAVSWLGAFAVMCLALGAVIEAREWHRLANNFAYLSFVQEQALKVYCSQVPHVHSGRN